MIALGGYEKMEFADDDIAREMEELAIHDVDGFELETGVQPGFEDTTDDEIGRACEELQLDEG